LFISKEPENNGSLKGFKTPSLESPVNIQVVTQGAITAFDLAVSVLEFPLFPVLKLFRVTFLGQVGSSLLP
jgi:hypothetical protein